MDLSDFQMTKKERKEFNQETRELQHDKDHCSPAQRGYIYGLCKKLDIDPHNFPEDICVKQDTRDLTTQEASELIEMLKSWI